MAIFELSDDQLTQVESVRFRDIGVRERQDLQRLLRDQIEVISPDTLVISEEFGEWEEGRRRVDLLGVDRDANLVVIELKRTEDGGHMELQAVRYAAMLSTMTFERAVEVFEAYQQGRGHDVDAESRLLEFLGWGSPDEDGFGQDVRIVLASAEFSKELTTSVLWLNDRGLDIRCIRLRPYRNGDKTLVDVSQVIPLREAEAYQVQVRAKRQREREARGVGRARSKYSVSVDGEDFLDLPKRRAIFSVIKKLCDGGTSPYAIASAVPWRGKRGRNMFRVVTGEVDKAGFVEAMNSDADSRPFDPGRFFLEDKQLIFYQGETFAVSNQWGRRTDEAIREIARAFPDRNIRLTLTD